MRAPRGTLIAFATQPGNVAQDGAGPNSPFATALAETIHTPGLGVFSAFNEVGVKVMCATGGAQQPWTAHPGRTLTPYQPMLTILNR
jgi:uncharacterized caspase-like protein